MRPIAVVGAYGVLAWSVPTAVYQPLPPVPGWLFWIAAVAVTVAAGLTWGSWSAAIAGAVVFGAAFTPWVASAALHRWPPDHTPAHPSPIDLQRGAYRGVALGDSRAAVIAHLGSPSGPSRFAALHHLDGAAGADAYGSMRVPDQFLVYRDTAVLVTDDRVVAIITSSSSAQTLRGIGPGDGLALVARRYPALRCEDHDSYGDNGPGGPPDCHGVIGSTRVWASQDPVQIVTVASRAAGLGF